MRKLALLLAAALMASAPVVAAVTTDGYAAAKKAKRVAKTPPAAPPVPEQIGPKPPFADIVRAIDDLGRELATYRHVYDPAGGDNKGGTKAAKKAR